LKARLPPAWTARLGALAAGLAAALAHPPFGLILGLLGYGLMMRLAETAGPRPLRSAFFRGWLAGVGYFGLGVWWVTEAFLVDVAAHGWMAPFALLLLALPHAAGTGASISLEISGDVLKSIFIDESYVRGDLRGPPPIVLLLGCDVANVAYTDAYARHIAVFRQAKAALVLGTVATVLGRDAAKVAGALIEQLADAAKKSSDRFGEVLRQAKREAVAASLMTALCLVAFGDADWRLK